MAFNIITIEETDSTNALLGRHNDTGCDLCVVARSQTAGRGQGNNQWESEPGLNLTFSLLTHPEDIAANEQYQLSMAIAVAVREAAETACQTACDNMVKASCTTVDNGVNPESRRPHEPFCIKWPNDIYYGNRKLGGILITCALHGRHLKNCITGVGLNVYQQRFLSDAPNPVSLCETAPLPPTLLESGTLLHDILRRYNHQLSHPEETRQKYLLHLYRRTGLHPYRDKDGLFMAETADVEVNGTLVLRDSSGIIRRYRFKEVEFVL